MCVAFKRVFSQLKHEEAQTESWQSEPAELANRVAATVLALACNETHTWTHRGSVHRRGRGALMPPRRF